MRLVIDYEMDGDKLPRDYLKGFISLIKKSFEQSYPAFINLGIIKMSLYLYEY